MVLGIELGSTRIKSVLVDEKAHVICQGNFDWENVLTDGLWSYSLEDAVHGMQASFAALRADYEKKFGAAMPAPDAIGISGMMHGYIATDTQDNLLAPFRTWRNTNAAQAADELTSLFAFHVPMRWSVSQYYQSVLEKMPHVGQVAHLNTLAGYIHHLLTGERVLGVNDASGMFPLNAAGDDYDAAMLSKMDALLATHGLQVSMQRLLPKVLLAGQDAGRLTEQGALLLDSTGQLPAGCPLCPPEGDMGTGMVATNCVAPHTANTSCGTSANLTVILDRPLAHYYPEIDVVQTPDGHPAALIHTNNCTAEIDAWVGLFNQVLTAFGHTVDRSELYKTLFTQSLQADESVGGISAYNFLADEPLAGGGRGLLNVRCDSALTLSDFMQAQIYAAIAPLSLSKTILEKENVAIDRVLAHGGFFKTPYVGQSAFSATVGAPVTVMENAGEGGAWGIALLAMYLSHTEQSLPAFLNTVFADVPQTTVTATAEERRRFANFIAGYQNNLSLLRK